MWPGSGYEGWFLVEGSVFEHAVDHVAAPTREADDGGVVVFALFAFALVIGHGGRVFGGCDERGLPQRVLEAFVAPPGGPFAFDAGAGLAGDGRYARVGGQMGGRFEVGDVAADAEQDVACGPDAYPGHRRQDREKRVVLQELLALAADLAPPVPDRLDVVGDGGDDGLGHEGAGHGDGLLADRLVFDVAVSHADKTMENQFRPDYTSYHVAVYDTLTGNCIKKCTHQGYADESMWARGQAWAIYGYTVVFRETGDPKYLEFAEKLVDVYLKNLPEDYVPYWDFNAPDIPNAPRDASAACVVASALLEMSGFYGNGQGEKYKEAAEKMLCSLSSDKYQSRDTNVAFLLHSTGHWPAKSEIDASIIYADYYYIEALLRLKRINEGLRAVE